jgi:hypothetical protein
MKARDKAQLVILVHGFNVRDGGKRTIGRLRRFFEDRGCEVVDYRYGWVGILGAIFGLEKQSRQLTALCRSGCIVVAHSHGCNVAHEAVWHYAPIRRMCYISPALDRDAALPPRERTRLERVDVWHSEVDGPVRWSRRLPWNRWGEMGATGYIGGDKRYLNFDRVDIGGGEFGGLKHSGVFQEGGVLEFWGNRIADCILSG